MKNNAFIIALLLTSPFFLTGCFGNLSYMKAMEKNQDNFSSSDELNDANFLVEAKSSNILETKLAEFASDSGYAATVVEYANNTIDDDKKLGKELDKAARKNKIKLPGEMSAEHQRLYSEIITADRRDFDKDYMEALEILHRDNLEDFQELATDGHFEEVRSVAAESIGQLENQQAMADKVRDQLLTTY